MNRKVFNILDLENILIDDFSNDNYKEFLKKYNVKTYKDLDNLIQDGVISDEFLIKEVEDKRNCINVKLRDISTDCLRVNTDTIYALNKYNIKNFQELGFYIGQNVTDIVNNLYLINAFKMAVKLILDNQNKAAKNKGIR